MILMGPKSLQVNNESNSDIVGSTEYGIHNEEKDGYNTFKNSTQGVTTKDDDRSR